ncbi:MAG: 2-oxoacid:acceptor oxidoreductase subunit alpha, partial [Thermaerobacterales bacterium]
KAMTATSGPGFSLMMENLGLAVMTETPCVVVNVQRAGPSTGLPTVSGQGDVMQVKWGSHGDYEPIAYAPATAQEMFTCTVKAFNLAERFRTPVFVMADESVGHLTERVTIPEADHIERVDRKRPDWAPGEDFRFYRPDGDLVPPMPPIGRGYGVHVTGLTHDERGYPVMNADAHDRLVRRLGNKILRSAAEIIEVEEDGCHDAEVVVISYGSTSRAARYAVNQARAAGVRVGMVRLITLWPFPEDLIRRLDKRVEAFIVPEMNLGQVAREVERFTSRPVLRVGHAGGALMDPERILQALTQWREVAV